MGPASFRIKGPPQAQSVFVSPREKFFALLFSIFLNRLRSSPRSTKSHRLSGRLSE